MELINTGCFNCGSNRYSYYDSENGYNLFKCDKCGLLFVNPRPSDKEISIASQTGIHKGDNDLNVTNTFRDDLVNKYKQVLNDFYKPSEFFKKSWLDIGCGNGELVFSLGLFSFNELSVKGYEPNINKVHNAKKKNLMVSNSYPINDNIKFDFISLLNVFSHLPNPEKTIKEYRNLLSQDGEILLETGNSSHLPPKYHYKPYLLPDHLCFANKRIIAELLKRTGFEIIKIKIYRGSYYPDLNLKNFLKELLKRIKGKKNFFYSFFPFSQHGDMYIRAKKSDIN